MQAIEQTEQRREAQAADSQEWLTEGLDHTEQKDGRLHDYTLCPAKIEAFREELRTNPELSEGDIAETIAMFTWLPDSAVMFAIDGDPDG